MAGAIRTTWVLCGLLVSNWQQTCRSDSQILDFTYSGDDRSEVTADVITGTMHIEAEIQTEVLGTLETHVAATLASVCPTQVKVIARVYQDIGSFKQVRISMASTYFMLPSNRDSLECKSGLANANGFKQMLGWRVAQGMDVGWTANSWSLTFDPAVVQRRTVLYPSRLPVPALSPTEPGPLNPAGQQTFSFSGGTGFGGDDTNCGYATSACVCATTESCAWAFDGATGGYRCVGLGGPATNISCSDCGLQAKCSLNQIQACDLYRDPCLCASSPHVCRWELSTMSCQPRGGYSTPCSVCSAQDHCDAPAVTSVEPAAGTTFGAEQARDINVTFDRSVSLQRVMEGVTIRCSGDPASTTVSQNFFALSNQVLTIQVASLPRETEANCDLALGAGIVRDTRGLDFKGTEATWFRFRLQDTMAPRVVEFHPANGAEGVDLGTSIELVFNEAIQLVGPCEVSLIDNFIVASYSVDSADVTISQDRRRVSVATGPHLQNFHTYSIRLPPNCARDDTGNLFLGLNEGVYIFHTQAVVFGSRDNEDPLKTVLAASIAGAGSLLVVVVCLIVWWRIRKMGKNFNSCLELQVVKQAELASSSTVIWTGFTNIKERRFSFDTWAVTGRPVDCSDQEAATPAVLDLAVPTTVAAPGGHSRPGTSESRSRMVAPAPLPGRPQSPGAPQPAMLRHHAMQGPRLAAGEPPASPKPPGARPPTLVW